MGVAAANAVRRMRSDFDSAQTEIRRTDQEAKRLLDTLEQAGKTDASPRVNAGGGGSSGNQRSGLDRVDQQGRIGTQILSGLGQGELGNTVGLIGDLAGGIKDVGLATTVTLGAIGLLGAGVGLLISHVQSVTKELEHEIDVRFQVIAAIKEQTTTEANKSIEVAEIQKQNAEANIAYLEQQRDAILGATADLGGRSFLEAFGDVNAYNNKIAEQQVIVDDAALTIGIYNEALADGATTTNDIALAVTELKDALWQGRAATVEVSSIVDDFWHTFAEGARAGVEAAGKEVIALAEDQRQDVNEEVSILRGSSEAAKERRDALIAETNATRQALEILQESGDTSEAVAQQIETYNATIKENESDIHALVGAYIPYLEALENVTGLITDTISGFVDGVSQIPDDLAEYASLAQEVSEAQSDLNQHFIDGALRASTIVADSQAQQTEIIAAGYQQAGDLAEQYNHEREQGERDLARELERIHAQAGLEQANAIGDRDALAFSQSEDAEALETDQAEQAADDRAAEREYQYQQEIQQLARSVDERLRTEQAALQRSLQMEEERWRRELQTRQTALTNAQQQLQAFATSEQNIMNTVVTAAATGLTTVQTAASNFVSGMISEAARLAQNVYAADQNSSVGAASGTVGYTTAMAGGGNAAAGQWAVVGEQGPELVRFGSAARVYSHQQSQQMAGGINININGGGYSQSDEDRTVARVSRELRAAYRQQRAAA